MNHKEQIAEIQIRVDLVKSTYGDPQLWWDMNYLLKRDRRLTEALAEIVHEKNLAAQGHWDATEKMGTIAYEALTEGEA